MITARAFAGKHYAVYGLARSGLATVEALLASGAKVTAWDANEEARAALLPSPSGEGLGVGAVQLQRPSHVPHPSIPSPEWEGKIAQSAAFSASTRSVFSQVKNSPSGLRPKWP